MIPASPNLAQIAVGQPQTPVPIANELAYIEAAALNASSPSGDTMKGPLTVPSLIVGGSEFSVTRLIYYAVDEGTVNALSVTNNTFPAPFAGMILAIKVLNTNTGSATLSVNGGSPYTIYQNDEALVGEELVAANWALFGFDGSFWNVIGMAPGGNPNVDQKLYAFPSGTRMLFQQASVPPGWTQDTTVQNDSLLRMVNGAGGGVYAGTNGVSAVLRGAASTDDTTLTVSQIPAHSHGVTDPGHSHTRVFCSGGSQDPSPDNPSFTNYNTVNGPQTWASSNSDTGISIQDTGGSGAHLHTLSTLNINSIDIIVGVKD